MLAGGDLRSIGKGNEVAKSVHSQKDFDTLMQLITHKDRIVAMRAVDIIQKITQKNKAFLIPHTIKILSLLNAEHIELKWHIALLVARMDLPHDTLPIVWKKLSEWALSRNESKIVRVNSLQALYNLSHMDEALNRCLQNIISCVSKENIPSINARIRKLKLSVNA